MASVARPLTLATLAFLSGLLPGIRFAFDPFPALVGAALLLGAAALPGVAPRRSAVAGLPLLLCFALLGVAAGAAAARDAARDCRTLLRDREEVAATLVLAASARADDGADGPSPLLPAYVRTLTASGEAVPGCDGAMRLRLPDDAMDLPAGTALRVHGEWSRFPPPVVPRRWPLDPRFRGVVRVDSLTVLGAPSFAAHPLLTLRGRTEAHLAELFPHHAPLAEALLLGRRERLDPAVRERFARAGMAHLLAISGMHVGLIAGMIFVGARAVGRWGRLGRRAPTWIAMAGIAAYLLVIGAPPSATRAGIMICLGLLGLLLQRPFAAVGVVAAAALLLAAHRPLVVLDAGFQLSFLGVCGILLARGAVLPHLPERWRERGWRRYLAETTLITTAATVATAPVVVWHFGLLSAVGLGSNLVAVPVMALALAGLVSAALVAPLSGAAGGALARGTEVAFGLLDGIATAAAAVPYGHAYLSRPAAWVWAAALVALLVTADAARRSRRIVRWGAAAGAVLVVLGAAPAVAGVAGSARGALELHFLDVGQGTAVAIRTPGDRWVLYDAGPADDRFDAGERRVLPFLRARGVRRVEAMILSHPHLDHIGGAPAVLNGVPVGALIEPGYVTASPAYLRTLRAAEERGVTWRAARTGRVLELDGVRFEFLWPDPETLDAVRDANEISAIVRVRFGDFAALLTGDAYSEQEALLVARHGPALRAQLLKAGHHGSRTSTSAPLLDAVRPELVVVSAGRRNRFGHPAPEVLAELRGRGIRVARTDLVGTVSVVVPDRSSRWRMVEP